MMTQIVSSFIGGLGFSIVFGVRKPYMLLIALNAALSWGVYLLVNSFWGDFTANMLSAVFCSLVAAGLAPILRVPRIVLQMPATVPMIPGGRLYYTMFYIFSGDQASAASYLFSTVRAIFALAIGFAAVSVLLKAFELRRSSAAGKKNF